MAIPVKFIDNCFPAIYRPRSTVGGEVKKNDLPRLRRKTEHTRIHRKLLKKLKCKNVFKLYICKIALKQITLNLLIRCNFSSLM
jgi:hypothetical protein